MRRVADRGRLEQAWRYSYSGLYLGDVLEVVAESQGAKLVPEKSSSSTTAMSRSWTSEPDRHKVTRATRADGAPARPATCFPQSSSEEADTQSPGGGQAVDESDCVSEVRAHAKRAGQPFRVRPDWTLLIAGHAVMPIELKSPATLGLWAQGMLHYHLTPAAQQPQAAHSRMQQALPTGGAQAEGDPTQQATRLAAIWQVLTQMHYLHTSHGVLTDAIVYVFVHARWTDRRLDVQYYVRHRADTEPTVIQCFAHICRLAAHAGPLDVPEDVLRYLSQRTEVDSGQGAPGGGAAGVGCVTLKLVACDQGCAASSACLSRAAIIVSTDCAHCIAHICVACPVTAQASDACRPPAAAGSGAPRAGPAGGEQHDGGGDLPVDELKRSLIGSRVLRPASCQSQRAAISAFVSCHVVAMTVTMRTDWP
jgi:hypothetical protein